MNKKDDREGQKKIEEDTERMIKTQKEWWSHRKNDEDRERMMKTEVDKEEKTDWEWQRKGR